MLHPSTRLSWISDAVGYGVRATRRIPKGTILWALDPLDRVFGPQEVQHLGEGLWPVLETYSYVNGSGKRVLCWDHGRFMNHSCEPVSLSPGVDFELAVRDIEEGEEITCDYTSLNLETELDCLCGSVRCRGRVSSQEFAQLAPVWDERLRDAVAHAPKVEQPLLEWVDAEALAAWAEEPESLPSAIRHHYPFRDAVHTRPRTARR
ncbi:MAG: SET domain-containing protein [Myxococcales bacterium]|nr:SET domain-containing protein [Myxococcales bacterium]